MKDFAIRHPFLTAFIVVPAIAGVAVAGIKALAGQPISGPEPKEKSK